MPKQIRYKSKESVQLGCDLILGLLYQHIKVEHTKSVNHWHFAWQKKPKTKVQTIFILAVFQFPDIFKGVIEMMGVLRKSKETAKAQKT